MSNPYSSAINPSNTPQSESLFGKNQIKNAAGGFVFKISPWDQLDRFLILGTEGGTYYVSERKLTQESIPAVLNLISEDGLRVVSRIVEISDSGRAPRNTPAIFALAACSVYGSETVKSAANSALPKVCRIGTHLFQWAESLKALNGHGPSGAGQRRALAKWYTEKNTDALAYQLAKYQQREGWSHRDLLRLCKPGSKQVEKMKTEEGRAALAWATGAWNTDLEGSNIVHFLPGILGAFEEAKKAEDEKTIVKLIIDHGLTREMIPSQWLDSPAVWDALLVHMLPEAIVRNLGKMSSTKLLKPLSAAEKFIADRLTDVEALRKSRLHPVTLLNARKVYGSGHGVKGSLSWAPSQGVLYALDTAFDLAFQAVEPCNKRLYIAIDGSGSMTMAKCIGLEALTCVEGAAAMAMVTARRENRFYLAGFDTRLKILDVSKQSSYSKIVQQLGYGGGTDASIPFQHAAQENLEVDTFIVYTDNETWHGDRHPCVALDKYRQKTGIPAKLAVVAMSATDYSIGDNADAGTMNVVGFDTNAPAVIADFCR